MCFLQWFERNACAFPDTLAVRSADRQLTYSELNSRADQIAEGLRAAGVTDGSLIAILLNRSPEMIAALLGVWKAGAAYLPLDPTTPWERVTFMLEDAAASHLIACERLPQVVPGLKVLALDELCATQFPSLVAIEVSAARLAYVIFTSGSTGKPKATGITHGGLANTLQGVAGDLQLKPEDVVLAWSTIAFDVACLEIFLPLAQGAAVYLVTKNDTPRLEQVRRSAATVMFATPTMYRLLLEEGWRGNASLQAVVGGEPLSRELGTFLAKTCRTAWNQYGPTETAICATRAKIDPTAETMSIGYPLPNVFVYLLDQSLQPVPKGSVGELYIGGAGVGLGYLNRAELSRERFLPDPFSTVRDARLFKTGDLAIEQTDGSFHFAGRLDSQVKIRGYRVELGEIEAALKQCEGVREAVVRAIEWEPGDRRLIAFVLSHAVSKTQWKTSLQRQLPDYMVPSEFVTLPAFPTTPGGKIDVQSLDALRMREATRALAPQEDAGHSVEAQLRMIWQRLLKVNRIGLHDDFFALGGHSLLAARMLTQVEGTFSRKLPHSVLVEHPTIYGLGSYLRAHDPERWPELVTIQPGGRLLPLFIAHGIGGSLLSFLELAVELGPEQPVYGLQLPSLIDQHAAQISVLATNYLRQIRHLQPSGPYYLAGHSSGGLVVFEMACQLVEQGELVDLLALLDCDPNTGKRIHRPFRDWNSFRASIHRAWAEFCVPEHGVRDLVERRIIYQKIKIRNWLATRWRGGGKVRGRLLGAEGYLALATRDYQLRSYTGKAVLFIAQDEPGRDSDPAAAWTGKILGGCDIHFLPGTHRTILKRPHVTTLAQQIMQRLPRSLPESVTVA